LKRFGIWEATELTLSKRDKKNTVWHCFAMELEPTFVDVAAERHCGARAFFEFPAVR
jgi:hypothetical protein